MNYATVENFLKTDLSGTSSRLHRTKSVGGGVCVYTRSSLKVKRLKEMSVTSETGFQQLWVQIQLKKLRSIVLCVAYRPDYCPVSCFVDGFMDKYSQSAYIREKHHRHCWPELWYVETAFPGSCSFIRPVWQRESDAVDQGADSRDWNFVHPYRRDYDLQYWPWGEEWCTEISHQWPLSGVCLFKAENLKTPS